MLVKTHGILLYKVKFSETSLIFHLLTPEMGVKAFMVKGVRSKKSKFSVAMFEYMNLLDVVASQGVKSDFLTVREVGFCNNAPFQSLDPIRNSILIFLAEFLHKSLVKSVPDQSLYYFVDQSIRIFSQMKSPIPDFHLWFITKISQYLGIIPKNNFSASYSHFSIANSQFVIPTKNEEGLFSLSSSQLLHYYLSSSIDDLSKKSVPLSFRNQFLDEMLFFYRYHHEHFHGLKSHEILKSIFHG